MCDGTARHALRTRPAQRSSCYGLRLASRCGRAAIGGGAAGAGALRGKSLGRGGLLCCCLLRCAGPRSALLCRLSVGALLGGFNLL